MRPLATLGFLLGFACTAQAGGYTLFDPTPDDQLRAFSTERPSRTDSTLTTDPGRVQIETNLYNYTSNSDDIAGTKTSSHQHAIGQINNVRIGLTENSDLQIVADLYRDFRIGDRTAGTPTDRREGFGDMVLRYKYSFQGNEGEAFSVAAIPFVKLPTNSNGLGNDATEYGFALPIGYNLPDGWSVVTEPIVQRLEQSDGRGYHTGYIDSLVVYKALGPAWSVYGEYWAFFPDDGDRRWQTTADFGAIYAVTDHLHVDAGVVIGTTEAAEDFNGFVGLAYRF